MNDNSGTTRLPTPITPISGTSYNGVYKAVRKLQNQPYILNKK